MDQIASTKIQGTPQEKRNILLDKNGRIVIPESVRSAKHMKTGAPVNVTIYPDGIWIATEAKIAIQHGLDELRTAFGDHEYEAVMNDLHVVRRELMEEQYPGLYDKVQKENSADIRAKKNS